MVRHPQHGRRLAVEALEVRDVPAVADPGQLIIDTAAFDTAHVLVKWKDGLAHSTGYGLGAKAIGNGLYRVNLPKMVSVNLAVTAIQARPDVQFAQPDYAVSLAATPNDPSMGSLWGLNQIRAPEAWNTSTGTGHTIVAVIDTGVAYNHPDLQANMWRNAGEIAGNGIDDDRDGYVDDIYGYDFANNDANPMDDNGHGTHVSGTIGAVGDNGIGVAGVNQHVKIMALKFLDSSGSGYLSNAVRALNYAVAKGAKVVNASFGGGGYDAAMATALTNARAKSVIVVAAAGNDGTNNDSSPSYPANYAGDNLVAVAATDSSDKLASFSNYGKTTVDIAAPGVSILSTLPNGKYGTYSGTSMATPHVAGALALVWDAHPTWTYKQVISAVLDTADRVPSLTGKVVSGRLNVARAIASSPGGTTPPPAKDTTGAIVTSVTFGGNGSAIGSARITFSEAINASTFTAADITLTGPTGKTIAVSSVVAVAGSGNTQFDVTFTSQAVQGTYTLGVGPELLDVAGNRMDQNKNGKAGETTDRYTATTTLAGTKTYVSTDVGKAIPNLGQVVSELVITDSVTIRDLNVQVQIGHSYIGDLRITLIGPDGTQVMLFNHRGGSGNDLFNTVFDDESANSIWRGVAPFAGSFKPEFALSAFDGKLARGTWKLVVSDASLLDSGKVWGWSMTVNAGAGASTAAATGSSNLPAAPPIPKDGRAIASLFVPV
jgi:serine protease